MVRQARRRPGGSGRCRRRRSRPSTRCGAGRRTAAWSAARDPAVRRPATEWIEVTSIAAAGVQRAGSSAAARPASSCPRRAGRAATGGARRPRRSPPPAAPPPGREPPPGPASWPGRARAPAPAAARDGGQCGGGPPRSQTITSVRLFAPTTRTPGTRAASATFCAATTTVSTPASAAATAGRTPGTGRSLPSRPSSARNIVLRRRGQRHRVGGGQDGDRDGQVEAAAALRQGRRGQADGDLRVRPALAAVDDRRADPVARLAQRRVRQADQDRRGQPARRCPPRPRSGGRGRRRGRRRRCGRAPFSPPPGRARW